MTKNVFFCLLLSHVCALLSAAQYQVVPQGTSYQILRNGKRFITSIDSPFTEKRDKAYTFRQEHQIMADGTKVWNATSTDARLNYRLEIALKNNGTELEITTSHSGPYPYEKKDKPQTLMGFNLTPDFYKNASYTLVDKDRLDFTLKSGKMNDGSFPQNQGWRWMLLANGPDSVIFDMNPIGIGDFNLAYGCGICRGVAGINLKEDTLNVRWGNTLYNYSFGGMVAGKIRIKDGTQDDFDKDHALRKFFYNDKIPPTHLLCFGAEKFGKEYAKGDGLMYSAAEKHGWVDGAPNRTVTTASGVYYSHQAGKNGHYRFGGLVSGLHIVTVGAGNPTGTDNDFSVYVNGKELLKQTCIKKGRFLTASIPVWVDGSTVDIQLKGQYIISSVSDQLLLANAEDFSCRRGFWVSEGHEPSALFNNANYKPFAVDFKASVKETVLPEHGKEKAGEYHAFHAVLEHADLNAPQNQWLFKTKIDRVGNNIACHEELNDPKAMTQFLDHSLAQGKNTIMFSGLHSRHTYPHSMERSLRYIKRFCDEAHKRGMKVINHHDTTLLWNCEGGFRKLAETLDGVNRSTSNQLPGFQYCILSPYFKKSCSDYIKKLVEAGVDGLQLDELTFVTHAGSCPNCREEFHKDTGWYLPVDETNSCFHSYDNEMYRAFSAWKQEKVAQWRADLLKELHAINPNVVYTGYGAFHLVLSPWGLWAWNSNLMKSGRDYSLMGKECQSPNVIANARMFIASQKFYNWFRYAYNIPVYTWCSTQDWKNSYFAFCGCLMNAQLPLDYGGGFTDHAEGFMPFLPFENHPDVMDRQLCREMARMGILYSMQSVHNDQSEVMPPGAFGFSQTLEEMHIPYVFLGDDGITDDLLKPLSVLYIGSTGCLSDRQLQTILKFVDHGGTLIMSGRAGSRNELANWRKTWPFADIMGFTVQNKKNDVAELLIADRTVSGTGLSAVEMSPAPSAEAAPFTLRMKTGESLPGIIEKRYGKGRILFFPSRIEEQFYAPDVAPGKISEFTRPDALCQAYKSLLNQLVGKTSLLHTDAPEKIFMTLYREGDQVLVHLLNGLASGNQKGDKITYSFQKAPFPALEKDIVFTVPAFGKHEIFAVSPDFEGRKALQAKTNTDGTVTVTLPRELLKGYTLVRIR